jgi:hypothetical protein
MSDMEILRQLTPANSRATFSAKMQFEFRSKRPTLPNSDVVNQHLGREMGISVGKGNPAPNREINDDVHWLMRNQSRLAKRLDGLPVEIPRNDIRLPIDAIGVELC